jgi:hypothetical protein
MLDGLPSSHDRSRRKTLLTGMGSDPFSRLTDISGSRLDSSDGPASSGRMIPIPRMLAGLRTGTAGMVS